MSDPGSVRRLVLLPGMDGTGELLQSLVDALGDRADCRVIAYPSDEKLRYGELVDRIARDLPSDGTPFALLAESFAGPIGLTLGQRGHPGLSGLILAVTFFEPPRQTLLELTRLLPLSWILSQPVPCWAAQHIMMGPDPAPEMKELLCRVLRGLDPEVLASRLAEVRDLSMAPVKIDLPVLYIQATQDRLLPSSSLEALRPFVPRLAVLRLPGGHLVLQTHAAEAADRVAGFLAGLVPPGGAAAASAA